MDKLWQFLGECCGCVCCCCCPLWNNHVARSKHPLFFFSVHTRLQAFGLSMMTDFLIITPMAIYGRVVVLPRIVSYTVFQGDPDIQSLSSTPLMSGVVGSLGPTGQAAYALGLASVAAVGATGFAARKWLKKAKDKERRTRIKAKVRYVQDADDPYKVTAVLEKKHSKYAIPQIHPNNKNNVNPKELEQAILSRNSRMNDAKKKGRQTIQMQDQLAVQKVDLMTDDVIMNSIMEMLLHNFVSPEVNNNILNAIDQQQLKQRQLSSHTMNMSKEEYKLMHEVAAAMPGGDHGILNMVLEMLTERKRSVIVVCLLCLCCFATCQFHFLRMIACFLCLINFF